VEADALRAAAVAYGQAGAAAIIYGRGVTQGPSGAATVAALADLALLTGNIGRPGTGLYPLRSGANSQGLADMGVRPGLLPGGVPLTNADGVSRVEAAWGASLADNAEGFSLDEMVSAIEKGEVGALYVVGADPALALEDEQRVRRALDKVGFLVVEDSFLSDTAQYADVMLPAAVAGEDEGTFTNTERFVQRVRAAAPALGESRPDWKIVQSLANALGADWSYATPSDIMREISEVAPTYRGVWYTKLENGGVQWPCLSVECTGMPILYADGMNKARASFTALDRGVSPTVTGAEFGFTLLTGSVREHHGTGVRTRRAGGLTSLVAEACLQINPGDAKGLGVADGEKVRVIAHDGVSLEAPLRLTSRVPTGIVFLPGFDPAAPVTRLLGRQGSGAPAVRVEKIS
jgi:predicted molibdopterin-dependent oxidoreductase YjgC